MTDVRQDHIAQFNDRHDVQESDQFHQLVEEMGELAEVYQRDADDEDLAEELADVVFVARSLAEIRDINLTQRVNEVADENLQKDESTDGQKVTKSGLGESSMTPRETSGELIVLCEFCSSVSSLDNCLGEEAKVPRCSHCDSTLELRETDTVPYGVVD